MKKSLSIILALVMVLSVISTFALTASAANDLAKTYDAAVNGDLLYELKFGQTEGVYKSHYLHMQNGADPTQASPIEIKDNGRTMYLNHTVATDMFYGDRIEGLTIGEGKQYTITFKTMVSNQTTGFYVNFPDSFASTDLKETTEMDHMFGYYGNIYQKGTLAGRGSQKQMGLYACDGANYFNMAMEPGADGFFDMAIEIDGHYFSVYINNTLFDVGAIGDDYFTEAESLGFTICTYNAGIREVKNVNIYKGLTKKTGATIPDHIKNSTFDVHTIAPATPSDNNKLLKTYAEAADKELLYKVKFNATEGIFTPKTILDQGLMAGTDPILTVTTTEDSATFVRIGESNSTRTVWGDTIEGLKISADTTYTMTYKIKANNPINMGVGFLSNRYQPVDHTHMVYGLWSQAEGENAKQPELNVQKGYVAVKGTYLQTESRLPVYPVADADGFTTVAIVIEGYTYTIYYWGVADNGTLTDPSDDYTGWALFESLDTRSYYNSKVSFPYADELAFMAFTWNTNLNLTVKDACIYKGVAVDLDEGKPAPTETTPEETEPVTEPETQAPATQAPATQAPATQAPATQAPAAEKSGCGSVIGGGLAVIAIISLGGVMIAKKRD